MLHQASYLLQNQFNPFPISGDLMLDDVGQLRFTLDANAAGCSLGWLEKALARERLKDRVKSGDYPVAFDLPVAQCKITWPKSFGGYGMKIDDGRRKWLVSLNYPSGGAIWQVINLINSKGTTKPWKEAFAAVRTA